MRNISNFHIQYLQGAVFFLATLLVPVLSYSDQLPLEPTREISFETDEGTWLSLDVSPDGKTIIFELLGDIYQLPIKGGIAKPITSGMAFDSQPAWSPDGKKIAFISDRSGEDQLWIADADGINPLQISSEYGLYASPAWSPDGQAIFVSGGTPTGDIWMYDVSGDGKALITQYEGMEGFKSGLISSGASVSPDGRYLYFAQQKGMLHADARFPTWEIKRKDLVNGTEITAITAPGSAFRPQISPDGRWLTYGTRLDSDTALRIRNLETSDDRILIYPIERDEQEGRYTRDVLPGYAFMPDSNELLISQHGKITRVSLIDGDARVVPFVAHVSQSIGPLVRTQEPIAQGPVRAKVIMAPRLSPDGDRLAFSAFGHIYVMDYPTGAPKRLTGAATHEFQPVWSPDGKWIAYVSWDKSQGNLWKMQADGAGEPIRLSQHPAFYSDPAWAPGGKEIITLKGSAYLRSLPAKNYLSEIQAAGTEVVTLSATNGDTVPVVAAQGKEKPHFNATGDRIYLSSRGDRSSAKLSSVNLDGTDPKDHVEVNDAYSGFFDDSATPPDILVSPDEKWTLSRIGRQLHLTAMPGTGTAKYLDITDPSIPHRQLSTYGADYFAWADGGKSATWSVGSSFFKVSLEAVVSSNESIDDFKLDIHEIDIKVEVPSREPNGTILLSGARVITMRGNEILENADILVADNRISAIGPRHSLEVPEGTHVMDVSGKTIMPGIVDAHTHWGLTRPDVLETEHWTFLTYLSYGITTSFDAQSHIMDYLGYQDLAEAGEILAPRLFSTGPAVDPNLNDTSPEDVNNILVKYRKYYKTPNLKLWLAGQRKVRQLIAMKSLELNGTPTNCGNRDAKMDLTHALDGFGAQQHNLPITPLYKDVVELFAQSKTAIVPTLQVTIGGPWGMNYFLAKYDLYDEPRLTRFTPKHVLDATAKRFTYFRDEEHVFPRIAADMSNIVKAGGIVGVGSHGMVHGLGSHWEMWALASGGMEPMEVLRAATANAAVIIGRATDLGSLEVGKMADILILDEDPLKDIHNTTSIRYVMRNGELFEAATLDQVWPVEKKFPPLSFWDDE